MSYWPTSGPQAMSAAGYLQLEPWRTPVAGAPLCLASQQIVGDFALRRTGCPEHYDVYHLGNIVHHVECNCTASSLCATHWRPPSKGRRYLAEH